jgi:protein-L-isoaspartate(D-aspartate) O-methyltransferase
MQTGEEKIGDGGGPADERREERELMVADQIAARGIRDERVLDALSRVPRHRFLTPGTESERAAYRDGAQPIAERQTISQPYIVALMTESLALRGDEKVLEIGAGSGYQTAVLAELARQVIAIERHAPLAEGARRVLDALGYANVRLFVGDGSRGYPDEAPYDAILCAAVAPQVPQALLDQLAPGGRLVLPVGPENGPQHLFLFTRPADGEDYDHRDLGEVAFVPLIGVAGFGLPEDLGDGDI